MLADVACFMISPSIVCASLNLCAAHAACSVDACAGGSASQRPRGLSRFSAAIASTQVAVSRFWALTDSAMAYRLPVPVEAQQLVLEYVSCVKWSASTWAAWQAKEAHANGGTPSSLA